MATNLSAPPAQRHSVLQHILGPARFVSLLILVAVLVVCVGLFWTTRDAMAHIPFFRGQGTQARMASSTQPSLVDQHPWQIAQALAPLAVSKEEEEYAHEAERLADHEVNQAFATSLRQASALHPALSGEAVELSARVAQLQQTAKEDQARVHNLTSAPGNEEDVKIAQAQLDLDVDELNDAQHDLARASGDKRDQLQQELAAHEAAVNKTNAQSGSGSQVASISTRQYGTLAGRIGAWFSQRSRYQLILQAVEQAKADAAGLTVQHNALEAQVDTTPQATAAADRLADLQRKREQRQLLTLFDDRIQTNQQLAAVYGKWAAQVQLQHRIVTNLAMRSLAAVALVLILAILCEAVGTHLLERRDYDRRRMQTMRLLLRSSVQLTGAVCVLLLTFGVPKEISTILGLATAGLTVALQSFILAFFGWFILMGRNGIRVGDWVEINGVAGEVVEINLFRTTILENREWAAKGHPTGRRATFINNFAVTGQFFNFSTVGQWMWDEIVINLPSSADTYAKAVQLGAAIAEETREDAERAEHEWKRMPMKSGMGRQSAATSVNLRPSGAAVDVLIRYVTRASDRLTVRNRLYERVMDVLHKPEVIITTPPPSTLTTTVLAAKPVDQDHQKRASMYT
jgi:small-conductance mechanosensitive channel